MNEGVVRGYVAMCLQDWSGVELDPNPWPVPLQVRTEMSGYLPVYPTREKATANHPGVPVYRVQLAVETGKPMEGES